MSRNYLTFNLYRLRALQIKLLHLYDQMGVWWKKSIFAVLIMAMICEAIFGSLCIYVANKGVPYLDNFYLAPSIFMGTLCIFLIVYILFDIGRGIVQRERAQFSEYQETGRLKKRLRRLTVIDEDEEFIDYLDIEDKPKNTVESSD